MNNTINFEKPIIGADPNKPTSLSNQSFPYNYIANPRRFEELLYSIFELQIRTREISGFDRENHIQFIHELEVFEMEINSQLNHINDYIDGVDFLKILKK